MCFFKSLHWLPVCQMIFESERLYLLLVYIELNVLRTEHTLLTCIFFFYLKRRQRSLCAQLRTSTLPLAVEVGRFKGTPEHLRLCEFCDLQVVEDEFHFVFYCPLYCDLRNSLFESIQFKNPDIFWKYEGEILCWLFENDVFALAKFIEKAWYLRQSILYPI